MTAATDLPARSHAGARATSRKGYGFRSTVTMEWLKLRSVRSTSWIMLIFTVAMVGLAILVLKTEHYASMSAADKASFDPTNNGFTGLTIGQLAFGVLGVLAVTSEFASGLIRSTFAAVPNRRLVLAAKAAVTGAVMLAVGEVVAFVTFAVGEVALGSPAPHATLGQPDVLRAVLMAGAYSALIGLIGMGLGAVIIAGVISFFAELVFRLFYYNGFSFRSRRCCRAGSTRRAFSSGRFISTASIS